MTQAADFRVMWLLNHGSAREFELPMLKRLGVREIFLPKSSPLDFRSASVDYSEDAHLTIPTRDLEILNAADWYSDPGKAVWDIVNRHFEVLFFILNDDASLLKGIVRHFRGVALWRAYGLQREMCYSKLLHMLLPLGGERLVRELGQRFFLAQAYPHLHLCEDAFMQRRALFLPLGLGNPELDDQWRGNVRRVFFVCPEVGSNEYYRKAYEKFLDDFPGIPYAIGGAQMVPVPDRNVLGYVAREEHERNMREMRLMFYHSDEPNHVHYHPFEAVRAGMPLLFMGGGLLSRLGGSRLPGCCNSIRDARDKMRAVLAGDRKLIDAIRASQPALLEAMRPDHLAGHWQAGFARVRAALEDARRPRPAAPRRRPRVAVMLPISYRGGTLRAAILLARAIEQGARDAGRAVDVVFAHLDDPAAYPEELFSDLPATIIRRPYKWKVLSREQAALAMHVIRRPRPLPHACYQVPDDGIAQFADCDLWMIVSDRLERPLVPLRPYAMIVYDYLRRYLPTQPADARLHATHGAERVLCTTEFTYQDALQFAGLGSEKLMRVPMLAPAFSRPAAGGGPAPRSNYFLWTTNLAAHKNHENALKALQIYYERLDGRLHCHVCGVETEQLLAQPQPQPHLQSLPGIIAASPKLRSRFRVLGELPDAGYRARLAGARFLWHAGAIDNGTFSVIEAASLGVPALSSRYPAMQEIDRQYLLGLSWMDAHDPNDMAARLKHMEENAGACRARLPSVEHLMSQRVETLAGHYWKAVEDYL
jgi:glycosyltransferase involved in cell wall biosynthesis